MGSRFGLGLVIVVCTAFFAGVVFVHAATQTLTISAGSLTATATSTVAFNTVTTQTSNQTSTSTLTAISASDLRGNGAGWSVTATATHLVFTGSTSTMAGSNTTVNFTGTYNGTATSTNSQGHGTYTVEITTGGSVGTAVFKWTNPASSTTTGVTTASSVSLDSGVSVAFGAATYVVGDKWRLNTSVQPYTGLTITPSNLAGVNSSILDGVVVGSSGAFSGSGATSAARTLLTSEFGRGVGAYTFDLSLLLTVLKNSLAGSHTGTLTISII